MVELVDTEVDAAPTDGQVQQLISAEKGHRGKGIPRTWRAPRKEPDDRVILVVDAAGGIALSRDGGVTTPSPPIVDGTAAGGALSGTYPNPGFAGAAPIRVGTPAGGDLTGTYPNPTLAPATIAQLIPAGVIWAYGGSGAPVGWLACDGATVDRASYPALFAAIGTAHNVGGESGTVFRLPDLRGRVPLGPDATHPLGQRGGSASPPHTHGMAAHTHATSLAHDHLATHPTSTSAVNVASLSDTHQPAAVGFKAVGLDHWHGFDVPGLAPTVTGSSPPSAADTAGPDYPAGGGLPPYASVAFIIRTGA